MLDWKVVPIRSWPGEQTEERKETPFSYTQGYHGRRVRGVSMGKTSTLLEKELEALGAEEILLQMAVEDREIRLDGWIRANARPSHPGVILTFDSQYGPLSYPCDNFVDWKSNVRAIALALEALRKVDRYGVTRRGEQYTGWKALPAEIRGGPHAVLSRFSGYTEDRVRADPRRAYLKAAHRSHPDRGGDAEDFSDVVEAARMLRVGN